MKHSKLFVLGMLAAVLVLGFSACDDGTDSDAGPEAPRVVAEKYRFEDGYWYDFIGSCSYGRNGNITVGETTITIIADDEADDFEFSDVYTTGGGTLNVPDGDGGPDVVMEWAYLYDADGKIGFIYIFPEYDGEIQLYLGAQGADPENTVMDIPNYTTAGMQDTINGHGYIN